MSKSIYDLELHETLELSGGRTVMRVPGGWMYETAWQEQGTCEVSLSLSAIFVAYHEEFKDENHGN